MRRLAVFLFWAVVFLAIAAGLDQLLVRVEMPLPVLAEVRTFYVDFRGRLLSLQEAAPPARPAPVTQARTPEAPPAKKKGGPAHSAAPPSPSYLYVDKGGELRFADRLEEVPAAYRKEAQRLER